MTGIGLYLEIDAVEGATTRLQAALGVAPVEAVLIRPAPGGRFDSAIVRSLIAAAQANGAAALIERDANLARSLGADGAHVLWSADIVDDYAQARAILGDRAIVGAAAGTSRHDAMSLAEAGAEYVAFALATQLPATDNTATESLDLLRWWAEVFEVPCVALGITSAAQASAVVDAGADFLGIPLLNGQSPATTSDHIRAMLAATVPADQKRGVGR